MNKTPTLRRHLLKQLRVIGLMRSSHRAKLVAGSVTFSCSIGRSGVSHNKREGDGATPKGYFLILQGYFRSARIARYSSTHLLKPILPKHGWCDDPSSGNYNKLVHLPFKPNHETLYRDDQAYDIFFVLGHNQRPRVKGAGSAIFLHLAKDKLAPTAGCIAICLQDMRRLLPRLAARCWIKIG